MNIFLSWSGDRSRAVAELLDEWLQCVIQTLDPWMSSKDIDRGSLWFSEINNQLQDTSIGIICLTKENINKPWILFEAGALAKGLSTNKVCTFLIDLEPSDVGTPLSQFNHTFPTEDSIWQLVRTLNNSLGEKALKEKILEQVFSTYWPKFEGKFQLAIDANQPAGPVEERTENDILIEILSATRNMDRRIRNLESSSIDAFLSNQARDVLSYKSKNGKEIRFNTKNIIEHLKKDKMLGELEVQEIPDYLRKIYDMPESVANKVFNEYLQSA